jgi:hypothetical protein
MGINISFFKTPKHRVFHYTPIYYDETRERIHGLEEEAKREKAKKEGKPYQSDNYIPGKKIRGSIRYSSERNSRHDMSGKVSKIVGYVTLLILFILIYYFANYFGWFLDLLK